MPFRRPAIVCVVALAAVAIAVVALRVRGPGSSTSQAHTSAPQADPAAVARLLGKGYGLAAAEKWVEAQREFERVAQLPEASRVRDASGQTVAERAVRQAEICEEKRTPNSESERRTANKERPRPKGERSTGNVQRSTGNAAAAACGPEALAVVLRARGVEATVEELIGLAGTDATGTTMEGLARAAEAKGLAAAGYQVTFQGLREIELPAVAWVNKGVTSGGRRVTSGGAAEGNHYVVITRFDGEHVWVVDPATAGDAGRRTGGGERPIAKPVRVRAEEFGRVWAGHVLEIRDEERTSNRERRAAKGE